MADELAAIATNDNDEANANLPLFRLPRELRDNIYALVIASEESIFYNVALEAGKQPQTKTSVGGNTGRACRQLRIEYATAVKRYTEPFVKRLVSGQIVDGFRISYPGPLERLREKNIAPLQISWTRCKSNGSIRNIRTITIAVLVQQAPLKVFHEPTGPEFTLFASFEFSGSDEDGSSERLSIKMHRKRPGCGWGSYMIPSDLDASVQQAVSFAKTVNWKGYVREYTFWFNYFVRCWRSDEGVMLYRQN